MYGRGRGGRVLVYEPSETPKNTQQKIYEGEGVAVVCVRVIVYKPFEKDTQKHYIQSNIHQSKKGGRMATTTPTHYEPKQTTKPHI